MGLNLHHISAPMKTLAFPQPLTKSSKTNINQVHETKPGNFIFQSEIFKNLINIIIHHISAPMKTLAFPRPQTKSSKTYVMFNFNLPY